MSEEIKEILDRLENCDNYKYRNDNGLSYKEIEGWEIDLLKDYITNIQEENEYSNHCNEELRKKITNLEYKIERLEEDNKQLKDLCDKYEEEHNTTFIEWQKDINIIDELEKYLKKQMEYYKLDTDYYVEYKLTLDKLNELKGDNK